MIKLIFDFPPVAQARPRATRFGRGIRLYDPKQVHLYKAQLAQACQFMEYGEPLTGPLKVELWFYRPVQKSISKKNGPYGPQGRTGRRLNQTPITLSSRH